MYMLEWDKLIIWINYLSLNPIDSNLNAKPNIDLGRTIGNLLV